MGVATIKLVKGTMPTTTSRNGWTKMQTVIKRWTFIILSTTIMVLFSEKMYWYVQGYVYGELIIVYMFGTYLFLWSLSYFRVNHFWGMFLASVLYPLYVEGIFTGIITTDLTEMMLFYFIGWHSTLSVIIGWYFHHKWLVERRLRLLMITSIALGLVLGLWATTFWLPESIKDQELKIDGTFILGQWSLLDYAVLLAYLGIIYVVSHYLLGKTWNGRFNPSRIDNLFVGAVLAVLFIVRAFSSGIFIVHLVVLFAVILIILYIYKRKNSTDNTVLLRLNGKVQLKDSLILFLIPTSSVFAYTVMMTFYPGDQFVREVLLEGIPVVQSLYGFIFLAFAIYWILRQPSSATENHEVMITSTRG